MTIKPKQPASADSPKTGSNKASRLTHSDKGTINPMSESKEQKDDMVAEPEQEEAPLTLTQKSSRLAWTRFYPLT